MVDVVLAVILLCTPHVDKAMQISICEASIYLCSNGWYVSRLNDSRMYPPPVVFQRILVKASRLASVE